MAEHFHILGDIQFYGCYHHELEYFKYKVLEDVKYYMREAAFKTKAERGYDMGIEYSFSFTNPKPELIIKDDKIVGKDVKYWSVVLHIAGNNYAVNREFWLTLFKDFIKNFKDEIIQINIMMNFTGYDDDKILLSQSLTDDGYSIVKFKYNPKTDRMEYHNTEYNGGDNANNNTK